MPEPTSPPGADGKAPAHPTPPLVASIPGTLIALATAIGGAVTAYQGYQESQALSRASYEALKRAVEESTTALRAQSQAQLELRSWTGSAIERVEKRLGALEKATRRPKPPPPPSSLAPGAATAVASLPPAAELTPKPPPAAPTPAPSALPPFDALETKP